MGSSYREVFASVGRGVEPDARALLASNNEDKEALRLNLFVDGGLGDFKPVHDFWPLKLTGFRRSPLGGDKEDADWKFDPKAWKF